MPQYIEVVAIVFDQVYVFFKFVVVCCDLVFLLREFVESPFGTDPQVSVIGFDDAAYHIAREAVLVVDIWFVDGNVAAIVHVQTIKSSYPQKSLVVLKQTVHGAIR